MGFNLKQALSEFPVLLLNLFCGLEDDPPQNQNATLTNHWLPVNPALHIIIRSESLFPVREEKMRRKEKNSRDDVSVVSDSLRREVSENLLGLEVSAE